MVVETERLYLRKFEFKDAEHLLTLNADPLVLKYTSDLPFKDLAEAQSFLKQYETVYETTGIGRYAVIRKEDELFLGWCGLKLHRDKRAVDVGYRFHRKFWNQGYASESTKAIITYAFNTLNLPFLIAHSHIENAASQKVLQNCGFQKLDTITYDQEPTYFYKLSNLNYKVLVIDAVDTWPVRHPVLRAGRPLEDVYMEADEKESTFHLGLFHNDTIVGVASFMEDTYPAYRGDQVRLRGMAVLPSYRNRGLAEILLKKGEQMLIQRGKTLLWFNARIVALKFYQNLGYTIDGEEFDTPQVGPHFRMKKKLI